MDRIEKYINRYRLINDSIIGYLRQHGEIIQYSKNEYFVLQHETKPTWCFLLKGLVGYQLLDDGGNIKLERLCPVNHYFVGTKHLFSKSKHSAAIQFLQPSIVYSISNEHLKAGIRQFKELNEIYHILKQHELDITQIFLRIPNIVRDERLAYLFDYLPEVKGQLTVKQLCSLLGYTDDRQYYRALNYYNNRRP